MATYPRDFIMYDVSHDEVYLTGSWCEWKPNAIKMTKIPNLYFIATVQLPAETKVAYKYIVNGVWMTNPEELSETDATGNTNNVFTTPKASEVTAAAPTATTNGTASTSSPSGATQEILDAKSSGVPVGAAIATTGVAAAAASTAVAVGLGKSETDGVTGVEKVAPGVTQAVANGSSVSEKDLAKPDLPTETSQKAPLPASTADAPLAPGSVRHEEGKGLFAVIGGLGAAAAAAATKAAYDLEHKIEEKLSGDDKKPALATTAVPEKEKELVHATGSSSFATTANAGSPVAPSLVATEHKDPAKALEPVATNDGVYKVTHDLAAIDFEHTKREVVNAVEKLGEVIATGLTGIGAAHEGAKGVASVEGLISNKDAPPAPSLPPVTGGPSLYPTDGTSAPQEIIIEQPKTDVLQVQEEATKAGQAAPAHETALATASTTGTAAPATGTEGKKSVGLLEKVKQEIKGELAPEKPTSTKTSSTSTGADKKATASTLGVGQAPSSTAEAPTTPKKGGAASGAGTGTAPATPSATPGDRKRKSSFFHKIKSALSPSK